VLERVQLVLLLSYVGIDVGLEALLLCVNAAGEALELVGRAAWDLGQARVEVQHLLRGHLGAGG
jgi:hypothetical protein